MVTQVWSPRPYHPMMTDHIIDVPKCLVFAFMGAGKTSAVLAAVSALLCAGLVKRVLVIAPLRVARSVWPQEVAKWSNFSHLRVATILGDERERFAGLNTEADIHVVNYDCLEWLVKARTDWPFDMVVADECTRLKSARPTQGGKRAGALLKVMGKVKRFVGLTGTPSPNGLPDLYGQLLFVDRGLRLGRSFTAFENRWFGFQRASDAVNAWQTHVKRIAFPHAQDEIQGLISDVCVTLAAEDWFPVEAPITVRVEVDLPPAARKVYRTMEREYFVELQGHEIEAVSAAAKSQKCIAKGTLVLTARGWVPIESVTALDSVWDGDEWVNCCGSVCNGYTSVVECLGVSMTSDHRVMSTQGWREAQDFINGEPSDRPLRADIRLPDSDSPRRVETRQRLDHSESYLASALCLWQRSGASKPKPSEQTPQNADHVLRVSTRRINASARNDGAPCVAFMGWSAPSLPQPRRQGLAQLRWAWDHHVQTLAGFVRKLLGRHGADVETRADPRPQTRERKLHPRQLSVGNAERTGEQHPVQRGHQYTQRPHDDRQCRSCIQSESNHATEASRAGLADVPIVSATWVYDIVNAGPRNRFTVRGHDGMLLVHNCLQFANGAAYVDGDNKAWVVTHDEKIEALRSIVEEANGAPILVAYNFISDRERILKAFPQARHLDKREQTIDEWNAGAIPILVAHPASAGHGLNLAVGGNILVFFGHSWSLENRMQIVERIGPVRQRQAGLNRSVFLYDLVARNTIDELVIERIASKRSVQDILLEAMKRKRDGDD